MSELVVTGTTTPEFAELRDVFGRAVAARPGAAAAITVHHHGRRVAELGVTSYPPGSRQLLFSVSKLVVAIALHAAEADGILDLDEPLARTWAPLRRETLDRITLRDVLAHRSGLARFTGEVALADILAGRDADLIARQEPDSDPGHAYHALSFGSLVTGALRARGVESPRELIARYVSAPLGSGLELGTPRRGRPEPVRFEPPAQIADADEQRPAPPLDRGLAALLADPAVFNSDEFLAAEVAAMGVVGSASDLAALLAATLDGAERRILRTEDRVAMTALQSTGIDRSLGVVTTFGSGIQLPFPRLPLTSATAFGHEGAGGSVAFADPVLGLAVGYTTPLFPASAGACPAFSALVPTLRLLAEHASM